MSVTPCCYGFPRFPNTSLCVETVDFTGVSRFVLIISYGHSTATLALQNGVDVKTVSGMLGHYSAGFTLDTYAHVTTQAQREAANTMGSILQGK